MKVKLAKTAGFCFGVRRAVDTVYRELEHCGGERIYTFGPIIHNEEVIKDIQARGLQSFGQRKSWMPSPGARSSSAPME